MRYIADLHIHSLFSRATSKQSHLRGLAAWAAVKGIDVVATGDFTHPGWFAHLHEELLPAEEGLYRLKPDPGFDYAALLPEGLQPGRHPEEIRFILSAEISCIYKRGGRVRKVHNLLYAPDMETVRRINTALAAVAQQALQHKQLGIGGLYTSGGEVTVAVVRTLKAGGFSVRDQVLPLAVYGHIIGGEHPDLPMITKGGFVGDKDSLAACVEYLFTKISTRKRPA